MNNLKIFAFADEASPLVDGQIRAMRECGIDGLEIRNVDGVNISDISADKAREVRKKLEASGLTVWSIGSPIGKIDIEDDFDAHLDKFKHTLELSFVLGAQNIRLFSFYTENKDKNDCRNEVIERLGRMVETAEGSGITLCHENEKGIYGDTPERCLEIHKALPTVRAIFDPANYIQCGVDTIAAWEMLADYVKYLHVKDALANGFVVPAGCGIGNLKHILDDFRSRGGECVTLEPHLSVFDGLSSLEKQGETSVVGEIYRYPSNEAAFAAAADALKKLL